MAEKLVQMTLRLTEPLKSALAAKAAREGQEEADYAAGVLARHLMDVIGEQNPKEAERMRAELEIKDRMISLARKFRAEDGFDPSVTLKVFQHLRADEDMDKKYRTAIGGRPGNEKGNPIKARINRSLGAAIKTAVGARPEKTANGDPVKVPVSGEYIFSYTLLARA